MALHEQAVGASDEWYTPPRIFEAMRVEFDLDPAHPGSDLAEWVPAKQVITVANCGLKSPWVTPWTYFPFVWLNPPFGGRNGLEPWVEKFFEHGNGVLLTPDRTSAPWWIKAAARADAVLFIGHPKPPRGRPNKIRFLRPDGSEGRSPAQGTTLMAAGAQGVSALRNAADVGLGLLMISQPAQAGDAAQVEREGSRDDHNNTDLPPPPTQSEEP